MTTHHVVVRMMAVVGAVAAAGLFNASSAGEEPPPQNAAQMQTQRAIGTRITFVVTQSPELAARSTDQITILFSDRSWAGATAPSPIFGDDILQEFSFSARDFDARNTLTFSRLVRDQTFLSSRFIRVVNHGGQGWGAGTLSVLVDSQPILDKVPMQPRKGDPRKGLQYWNRERWSERAYWEMELPRTKRY
jgi:hypothetical protein